MAQVTQLSVAALPGRVHTFLPATPFIEVLDTVPFTLYIDRARSFVSSIERLASSNRFIDRLRAFTVER